MKTLLFLLFLISIFVSQAQACGCATSGGIEASKASVEENN